MITLPAPNNSFQRKLSRTTHILSTAEATEMASSRACAMFQPDGPRYMRVTTPIWEDITNLPGILHAVEIPVGYRFDGASIPRLAWAIIGPPFEPDFCLAACVHDYYCDHSHEIGDYQARVIGDAVFFALLKKAGVPRWRRVLMYMAVRLNSWWFHGSQPCAK